MGFAAGGQHKMRATFTTDNSWCLCRGDGEVCHVGVSWRQCQWLQDSKEAVPMSWKEFREEEHREHLGTKGVMDALRGDSAYPSSIQWPASFRLPMSKLCVLFLLISIWNYHLWHSFRSLTSRVSVFEENWNANPVTLKWELKIQKQVKAVISDIDHK